MRSGKFLFLSALLAATLTAVPDVLASSAATVNLPDAAVNKAVIDDDIPDVTARVARISFIKGEVQIKRLESQEWEQATLNLPIVEGDEITTAGDARLEIQFNRYTHLRLAENSYLKVSTLTDEGIAVSLPQGKLSVRADEFDKDKAYLEIDAPGTTVAVQRSGTYRLDSGQQGDSEVRVSVTDDGEARIYSESSGFMLRNGRSARVFISGNAAGEWETGDADRYADEFDGWAHDRNAAIASSLKRAYYDKYYDQDIYGAEDLNDYGDWVYTRSYGYVWRPFRNSISSYTDWSPYRYGHWRWVPPYGWTWINDEPWGWATYHHGRWFYDGGYWYWTPYGQYRTSRSWWSPALVFMTTWGGNICWYPLPYNYGYYNYNWYYHSQPGWGGNHGGGGHQGGGNPTPTPAPTPTPPVVAGGPLSTPKGPKKPPLSSVPPTGVVTVAADEFGKFRKGTRTPPLAVATTVLSTSPDVKPSIRLPMYTDVKGGVSSEIRTAKPRITVADAPIKTGAMVRKTDEPLDRELRTKRVFGGRPPLTTQNESAAVKTDAPGATPRKTGAVNRLPTVIRQDPPTETVRQPRKPVENTQTEPGRPTPRYTPKQEEPVRQPPRYEPPPKSETPRYVPPPKTETPRYDPPPTRQPPRSDPPPTRQPPAKTEPKPDKPAPSEVKGSPRKPDGR